MSVLVVQYLVTLDEATRILRVFKQKQHADKGYFFELQDLGGTMLAATAMPGLETYSDKLSTAAPTNHWWRENAYLLRVYRELPPKTVPDFTPDQLRKLREFADHLLEVERCGGVMLD